MSNIGFRIFESMDRADQELIEQFRVIPSSNISDVLGRFSSVGGQMQAYHPTGVIMAGSAFTVRVSPADNLMLHKAIEIAQPGDVIVVEAGGELTNAITGEMMCTYAKKKGIEGFIIDGAIRDRASIKELRFPVYAKGTQPRGPYKDGPGEINVPISCSGVVVNPGDIIIGDDDGFTVIPLQEAKFVLEKAKEKVEIERVMMDDIVKGTLDQSWVDKTLQQKGCETYHSYNVMFKSKDIR
jgi:RraA family protein